MNDSDKRLLHELQVYMQAVASKGIEWVDRHRIQPAWVLDGAVIHRDSVLSSAERADGKKMMVCVSRGKGMLTLDI